MTRLRLFRGTRAGGELHEYEVAAGEGMVVLDAVHMVQAEQAPDLAVRWNCKAGKCGSCSAENNRRPKPRCITRLQGIPPGQPLTGPAMRVVPAIHDPRPDVSPNHHARP